MRQRLTLGIAFFVPLLASLTPCTSALAQTTSPPAATDIARFPISAIAYQRIVDSHDKYVHDNMKLIEDETLSGDSQTYYATSYLISGLLNAAEGTDDPNRFRLAMRLVDNMISKAVTFDTTEGPVRGWGPADVNGRPPQTNNFQAMVPIARLAALVLRHPRLSQDAEFSSKAHLYWDFVDQMVRYWVDRNYHGLIPWLPVPDGSGTYPTWNDKCSLLGSMSVGLYFASGSPYHKQIAEKILSRFSEKLQPLPASASTLVWDKDVVPNVWGGIQPTSPDTSHANREPLLLLRGYEAGLPVQREQLEKLSNLFTQVIWNGSSSNPMFANYIDGSNQPFGPYIPSEDGLVYAGWAGLGRFSANVNAVVSDILSAIEDGVKNASMIRMSSIYGKIELTGHAMNNASPAAPCLPRGACR